MIKSLFALDCFAMLSFSSSYPPVHTKMHTIQSWKMESFCLSCPGWERNLLAIFWTIQLKVKEFWVILRCFFFLFLFPQACYTYLLLKSMTSNARGVKAHGGPSWDEGRISGSGPGTLPPLCLFHTWWGTSFEIHSLIQSLWW